MSILESGITLIPSMIQIQKMASLGDLHAEEAEFEPQNELYKRQLYKSMHISKYTYLKKETRKSHRHGFHLSV
jgi:hypothetical protein